MSKVTIKCSCGCGKTIERPERVVKNSKTGFFFLNKQHAGDYYLKTGTYRGKPRNITVKTSPYNEGWK
jgi:hypothetical protein